QRLGDADLKLRDVHTVIATHSHPDHFGGAGQLAQEVGADVVVHSAFARWLTADPTTAPDIFDIDAEDIPTGSPFDQGTPWGTEWGRPPDAEVLDQWIRPQPTRWVR